MARRARPAGRFLAPAARVPWSRPTPLIDIAPPARHGAAGPRAAAPGAAGSFRDPREAPQRGQRAPARRLRRGILAASAFLAAIGCAGLVDGGRAVGAATEGAVDVTAVLTWAGFGIDQVSLAGHRYTPDHDILDALDLGRGRTWASFDARAARARVERLPWVASATLTRVHPGRLEVEVVERKAFGRWRHQGRTTLIDQTGRSLSDIAGGQAWPAFDALPLFEGAGADAEAAAITGVVGRHPELARRVARYERVGGRRWTLHLANRTTLHLPPDREALVLGALAASTRLGRLVEEPGRILDLRAPGRIAVRRAAPGVAP